MDQHSSTREKLQSAGWEGGERRGHARRTNRNNQHKKTRHNMCRIRARVRACVSLSGERRETRRDETRRDATGRDATGCPHLPSDTATGIRAWKNGRIRWVSCSGVPGHLPEVWMSKIVKSKSSAKKFTLKRATHTQRVDRNAKKRKEEQIATTDHKHKNILERER